MLQVNKELNIPAIHLDGINFNSSWTEIDKNKRTQIILENWRHLCR